MFEKFQPHGDRILVKILESEETTMSGLIIPDTAKERAQQGTVLAVGAGKTNCSCKEQCPKPQRITKGARVFFGKYAGTELEEGHLIIKEDEILGIIE